MTKFTIHEIEDKLMTIQDLDHTFVKELRMDERKGVQRLLIKWEREKEQARKLHNRFVEMTKLEQEFRKKGFYYIAGIDEVGRGPLAGPVVASAVILPETFYYPGVDDSKKLTEQKREEIFSIIQREAIAIGIGVISAEEIDEINIYEATKKAMLAAIIDLSTAPDFLLIDAMKLDTPYPFEAIIKGDGKSISIAAASIVAKVTRDRMLSKIGEQYPEYGFSKNMGYGTKEHLDAIEKYGITPYHRKSFAPVKNYITKF
ncbi:ribonuclease HII [Bacillus sp. 03113]|uniref:ribonuclease HII n=1 Tax=Bacillus sp. 03113 TaxID=2578211 RepID=UPI001141C6F2|nr:ribonuclease HII [Bacillus sp. 03113]